MFLNFCYPFDSAIMGGRWIGIDLTFHEAEHGLQITAALIDHVVHVTRRSAIPSQVVVCAHPGWTFIAEVTVSLFRTQSLGPVRVVYPISPHVYVTKVPSHHDHVRAERSAFGFAHQYLYEYGNGWTVSQIG